MEALIFGVFAFVAIASAILMVVFRNPVHSALSLVTTLFALAGLFVLLEAHFLAAVQIIVYAGAIMVLFLFVIMLLNLGHPDSLEPMPSARVSTATTVKPGLRASVRSPYRMSCNKDCTIPSPLSLDLRRFPGLSCQRGCPVLNLLEPRELC